MKRFFTYTLFGLALALLALGAARCPLPQQQAVLSRKAPSPGAEMLVAFLGGFRGLASEFIWFHVDRLQDSGRFVELAQLFSWLTFLEPHTSEVWSYAGWNLAYNISVMMSTPQDKWRWVQAGIRLLRDDGLTLNPDDPDLCRELSWMFFHKLSSLSFDRAAPYYREQWRKLVAESRAQGTEQLCLKMDPSAMQAVDAEYGAQDWGSPYASALYWAARGLPNARTKEQHIRLRRMLYQTLMMEARENPLFAPRALAEIKKAHQENPSSFLEEVIEKFAKQFALESPLRAQ